MRTKLNLEIPIRFPIKALGKNIFSFETTFVLFLFAGVIKGDPRLQGIPIDLTLLLFGVSLLSGIGVVIKRKLHINHYGILPLIFLLLFFIYAILSLLWSPSVFYAFEKSIRIPIILWAFVGSALIISGEAKRCYRFITLLFILILWYAFEGILLYITTGSASYVVGTNYIGFSRIMGIGIIITLAFTLYSDVKFGRIIGLGLIMLFGFSMLITGGRGGLVALLATLLLVSLPSMPNRFFPMEIRKRYNYYIWFAVCIIAIIIVYFILSNLYLTFATSQRLAVLFTHADLGSSAAGRIEHYKTALDMFSQNLLVGYGFGSWTILTDGIDVSNYPHNIIFEIMAELGTIGLILFILFFITSFRLILTKQIPNQTYLPFLFTSLAIMSFMNANFSGDITDNRWMFAFWGFLSYIGSEKRLEH